MSPLLDVKDLHIFYGQKSVVQGVSFALMPKESLGIVGASGSGKSSIARALMRLLPLEDVRGEIFYHGMDMQLLTEKQMRSIRGREMGIVFQDPMTSLNPTLTIGTQICEGNRQRKKEMLALLERVGFSDPYRAAKAYPHMLSGGMRQRAMMALALFSRPKILIADEPTTSLDTTTQMHILELLRGLQKEMEMGIILITHDLSIVAGMCDRALVMESGQIVEDAYVEELFSRPRHAATKTLLAAIPRFDKPKDVDEDLETVFVSLNKVSKHFLVGKEKIVAVCDVTLSIPQGKTLGLIGESGCGKSTLGRMLLRLERPSSGEIVFDGVQITGLSRRAFCVLRPHIQGIFQNPYAALSPKMRIEEILYEPFTVYPHACEDKKGRIRELVESVGLSMDVLGRYPHEFSGGQRQRIAIARALVLNPKFLVCDEPFSALDAVIQEQIVALLQSLQKKWGLTYLVIAHNLAVVKYISDYVAVMYLGHIVEWAPAGRLYVQPMHPYTQALFDAVGLPDPILERVRKKIILTGEIPSPVRLPRGCPFATRCPRAQKECFHTPPQLREIAPQHYVACHFVI